MRFLEGKGYTARAGADIKDIYHLVICHLDIYSLDEFGGFGAGNEGGRSDEKVEAAP